METNDEVRVPDLSWVVAPNGQLIRGCLNTLPSSVRILVPRETFLLTEDADGPVTIPTVETSAQNGNETTNIHDEIIFSFESVTDTERCNVGIDLRNRSPIVFRRSQRIPKLDAPFMATKDISCFYVTKSTYRHFHPSQVPAHHRMGTPTHSVRHQNRHFRGWLSKGRNVESCIEHLVPDTGSQRLERSCPV